jgi:hypothetical protein
MFNTEVSPQQVDMCVVSIFLTMCDLPGPIPAELGDLISLQSLNLSNNKLTGTLRLRPPLVVVRTRIEGT